MDHDSGNPLVYSTESGRICSRCGKAVSACTCRTSTAAAPDGAAVRIRRETKGRHGKTVTLISGIPGGSEAIRSLAADLKKLCGSGGSAKDGIILIQGDHRSKIAGWLEGKGMTVKQHGG